ncbi:VCBS repeat-containing protein [Bradyrhizobium sp. GM0.4]
MAAFVVAWQSDSGDDTGRLGIFAQRYDASGNKVGAETLIFRLINQAHPSVAALTDGGFVVTFDASPPPAPTYLGYDIRFAHFNADGTSSNGVVTDYNGLGDFASSVVGLPDGGFVVSWQSEQVDGTFDILAQRHDGSGIGVGSAVQVNTTVANGQLAPHVAALAGGGFVVAWQSEAQDGSGLGIFGQRFDANGAAVGTEFQINTYTSNDQNNASVVGLSTGGFVVAWESTGQDGSGGGIYGQIYDGSGSRLGGEFSINTYTSNGQGSPKVTAFADGNFVVVWRSAGQDGSGDGVYGQLFSTTGQKIGEEFLINAAVEGDQTDPVITVVGPNDFEVAWTSGGDIFARHFSLSTSNHAPVASDFSTSVNENAASVLLKGVYADSDAADTFTFSTNTTGTIGTVINNNDGTFTYDPNGRFDSLGLGETAIDTFTYTVTDNHGASSNTATATITIHGVNDTPITPLFTTGADVVDFNYLTDAQRQAIDANPQSIYQGLGGSDVVTLPDQTNYQLTANVRWDPGQTFVAGDTAGQSYKIVGGNGDHHVALGHGNDTVRFTGDGRNVIDGFAVGDTIDLAGVSFDSGGRAYVKDGAGTSNATLEVSIPGQSRPIDLVIDDHSGQLSTESIKLSSGENGGTNITLQPGLSINVTYDDGVLSDNDRVEFERQVNLAVSRLENHFTNPLTINLNVGWGSVVGEPVSSGGKNYSAPFSTNYNKIHAALMEEVQPIQVEANGSLPGNDDPRFATANFIIPVADAQALKLLGNNSVAISGWIGFGPVSDGNYFSTALHEITEVMGRESGIGDGDNLFYPRVDYPDFYTTMDLFRYSDPGTRDLTPYQSLPNPFSNQTAYFSIDSGIHVLGVWNNIPSFILGFLDADTGDWSLNGPVPKGTPQDAFVYRIHAGPTQISPNDLALMNVIGWSTNSPILNSQLFSTSPGKEAEGYVFGATVFADVNSNGLLDSNELSTVTDENGNFVLPGGAGPLVAFGGIDTSTGLLFKGQLSAPEGFSVITPLTALLANLSSDPQDQQKVLASFGLSSSLDLTTFDPIAAAQGGSADGAATEVAGAKVYDTVEMIASALAGAGGSFTASLQTGFAALASSLDGAGINLNDKTALSALITQVAKGESVTLSREVADAVASIIAAGNGALDHVLQTDQPGTKLLSDVAGIELIMQGAASTAITDAGGSLTKLEAIANLFTGTNLDHLITQAQTETQNPGQDLGPLAFDGSASTDQNTVLNGTVSAVDLAGNSITYALDGSAPTGLTFKPDGTFTFDPGSAYKYLGIGEGTTLSFQFTASDGQGTDSTATETITINGLNDNPTAAPDSNGVAKGQSISVLAAKGVLANDNDPDVHDQLSVEAVNGKTSAVGHVVEGKYGSLTLNADGSYTYHASLNHDLWDDSRHASREHGSWEDLRHDDGGVAEDVFKYTVSDGHGGLSTSTLSIVVFDRGTTYLSGVNTTLTAGKGPYVLDGSAGGDTLKAGHGDAVLIGGNGDTLIAGRGEDTFLFHPNFGTNTITNFNIHKDTLQFDDGTFHGLRDLLAHTTDTPSGAVISDGHGDSVTLFGVTSAQLHHEGFHLIT